MFENFKLIFSFLTKFLLIQFYFIEINEKKKASHQKIGTEINSYLFIIKFQIKFQRNMKLVYFK